MTQAQAPKVLGGTSIWRRGLSIALALLMAATSLVVVQATPVPPADAAESVQYIGRMDFHSFRQGVLADYDTWYSEGVVLQAPPGKIPQDVANQWMQWYVAHDRIIEQMNFVDFDATYRKNADHLGLGRVKVLGFATTCGLGCGNKSQAEVDPGFLDSMLADPLNMYHQGQWTMLYEMSRGGQSQDYFNRGVWPINTLFEPALMVALFYNALDNVGYRDGSAFEVMFDYAPLRLIDWELDPAQRSYLEEFSDPYDKLPGAWSSGTIINGILFRILQVSDSQTIRQILENLATKSQVHIGQGANNAMCDFQHAVNEATEYQYASVLVHRWRLPGNCGWTVSPLIGDGGIPGMPENQAPTIEPTWDGRDLQGTVGEATPAVEFTSSDPDGGQLSFSASGMPPGLSVNPTTGTITGTFTQADTYTITMTVSDGRGGTDSVNFRWIVSEPAVISPGDAGDADCDGVSNIVDALVIAEYAVGNRTAVNSCPLNDPATEVFISGADANRNGVVDIVDSLLIAQCEVGVANRFCPAPE